MKKKLLDKLRSRRGDSIAEVLVALLISAVALVMLASMIAASSRLILRSKATMEEYDQANNALAQQPARDGSQTSGSALPGVSITDNVTLTIQDSESNSVYLTTASIPNGNKVTVYKNEGYGGNKVIAYKKS